MATILILALLIAGVFACLLVSYTVQRDGTLNRALASVGLLVSLAVAAQALLSLQGAR